MRSILATILALALAIPARAYITTTPNTPFQGSVSNFYLTTFTTNATLDLFVTGSSLTGVDGHYVLKQTNATGFGWAVWTNANGTTTNFVTKNDPYWVINYPGSTVFTVGPTTNDTTGLLDLYGNDSLLGTYTPLNGPADTVVMSGIITSNTTTTIGYFETYPHALIASTNEAVVHVNPVTGDDRFDGHFPVKTFPVAAQRAAALAATYGSAKIILDPGNYDLLGGFAFISNAVGIFGQGRGTTITNGQVLLHGNNTLDNVFFIDVFTSTKLSGSLGRMIFNKMIVDNITSGVGNYQDGYTSSGTTTWDSFEVKDCIYRAPVSVFILGAGSSTNAIANFYNSYFEGFGHPSGGSSIGVQGVWLDSGVQNFYGGSVIITNDAFSVISGGTNNCLFRVRTGANLNIYGTRLDWSKANFGTTNGIPFSLEGGYLGRIVASVTNNWLIGTATNSFSISLTTNINVTIPGSKTNQLQFVGGLLTGNVPQ